ncbi:MAG: YncE family protein [Actinomycetota bacterium]
MKVRHTKGITVWGGRNIALVLASVFTWSLMGGQVAIAEPKRVARVAIGSAGEIAVNPVTARAYVESGDGVEVLDLVSNKLVARLWPGDGVADVAIDKNANRLYVNASNRVVVYDGATNAKVATIASEDGGSGLYCIAVNSTTGRVYVTNLYLGTLLVIDGATNSVLTSINLGAYAVDVAVNEATNRVFVTVRNERNSVIVIDGATNQILGSVSLGEPQGWRDFYLAVDERTNRLFAASYSYFSVKAVDIANMRLDATIPIGGRPIGVAVNPETGRVYAGALDWNWPDKPNHLVTIDQSTNKVLTKTVFGGSPTIVEVYGPAFRVLVTADSEVQIFTEDPDPPTLLITTPSPSVISARSLITGTVNDDLSGVKQVEVTFAGAGLSVSRLATLTCSTPARLSCTWQTPAPDLPGPYAVRAWTVDRAGSSEDIGKIAVVTVV